MNHRLNRSRVMLTASVAGNLMAQVARVAIKDCDEYEPPNPTYGKPKRSPGRKLAKLKKGKARL